MASADPISGANGWEGQQAAGGQQPSQFGMQAPPPVPPAAAGTGGCEGPSHDKYSALTQSTFHTLLSLISLARLTCCPSPSHNPRHATPFNKRHTNTLSFTHFYHDLSVLLILLLLRPRMWVEHADIDPARRDRAIVRKARDREGEDGVLVAIRVVVVSVWHSAAGRREREEIEKACKRGRCVWCACDAMPCCCAYLLIR